MNRTATAAAGLVCAATLALAAGAPAADLPGAPPAPIRTDPAQPQSPPRPEPKGIRYVDQGQFDPRLKGYFTPAGFRVDVVADAPTVINPVGLTFAADGTPHVMEWWPDEGKNFPEFLETFTYKDGTQRKIATMKKRVKDAVKALSDHDGDGTYDHAEVIIRDELPSSILLHDGWVYLSGRGSIRRYRQTRPGGPYDKMEVIAQGFCGFHHHQVSGMTIGNDGWLYVTSGDDDNYAEGSDGSRATVLRTGAVFRMRPDGSHLHTYSLGWRNPYRDLAFDANFHWFHVDNDNEDGSKFTGCRLMHVAEEADFGWRLLTGARCCKPDHLRGGVFGEVPGKLPAMLKTGRGSPAGLLIPNDTRLPEAYRGLLYYPDVFRKIIRAYRVRPAESTFEVAEELTFLRSDDPLFRPCQTVLGPDGAIYVVDWRTDSGGAGKLWGDGKHGRIYRVRWAGTPEVPELPLRPLDSWAKVVRGSDADLLAALSLPDMSDRLVAQRELVARGPRNRDDVLALLADARQPAHARLHALGLVQSFWDADVRGAFLGLLGDASADVRRLAADGLALNAAPGDRAVHEALLAGLADPESGVRRAAALAVGKVNGPGAADALVNAFRAEPTPGRPEGVYLADGLLRAIERTGSAGVERLVDLALSGVPEERDRAAEAFLALRTRAAASALPRLLGNPHLSIDQRAQLVKSYLNYQLDPPISLAPLLEYCEKEQGEAAAVKLAALDVITGGNALADAALRDRAGGLLSGWLADADPAVRRAALRAAEATRYAPAAPRVLAMLADRHLPAADRLAAVKALRVLDTKSAAGVLRGLFDANAPLSGTPAERDGVLTEALRSLGTLEADQARAVAEKLLDGPSPALAAEAVGVLGLRPAGAKLIAERYLAKKLPRELFPQVTEALTKHAGREPSLAPLLSEVRKGGLLALLARQDVAKVRETVARQGDAARGKALFLNSKILACVTCHRMEGVGGQVGPDLTRVWESQSVEKLFETIAEPSKEIKEGYQAYNLSTVNGQVFTGLKVSDTKDEVVLREAGGRDTRVARKDIEELTISKLSLMPADAVSQLTYEQFIDLVAFLKDRPAQESLRGVVGDYLVAGGYSKDVTTSAPELPADPKTTGDRWKPAKAEPDGRLDLSGLDPKKGTAAYALTHVFSPKAQPVRMHLSADGPARVWVNGKPGLTGVRLDGGPAWGLADRVELPAGWSPVVIKAVPGGAKFALSLRFEGEGVRAAAVPDAAKP